MRILFFLMWVFPLCACYIGNPADPAIMNTGIFTLQNPLFKITTGYLWDYISNKNFKAPNPDTDPYLKQFAIHTQSASASLIFLERLQLFGTAGGSKQNTNPQDLATELVNFHGAYQFSWSAGAKVVLLQWGKTYFSCGFNYFDIPSSHKSFFKFLNRTNLSLNTTKQDFYLREWQIDAGLSSRIFFLTPYGGVVYLRSKLHIEEAPSAQGISYFNKQKWGFFYGLTVSITGRFHLNFERRVRDEFGYSFGTTAVF